MVIAPLTTREFLVVVTNASSGTEAVSIYDLGSQPTATKLITVTTDSTAGNRTFIAAEFLGGLILRDTGSSARSDVTPTAAALVAAIPNCAVGSSFRVIIRNTSVGAGSITLTAASAAVTISGTATIAYLQQKEFLVVVTNATGSAEAVTIYSLGTVVF